MSKYYLNDLVVKPLENGKDWELQEDFYFWVPVLGKFCIKESFIFDFASIPKVFRLFFQPATGLFRYSALCHDYFYREGIVTRKEADETFRFLMESDGVNFFKRNILFYAVRVGGWASYKARKNV